MPTPFDHKPVLSLDPRTRAIVRRALLAAGVLLFLLQLALVVIGSEPFKSAHFVLPILICLFALYEQQRARRRAESRSQSL